MAGGGGSGHGEQSFCIMMVNMMNCDNIVVHDSDIMTHDVIQIRDK